MSETAAFSRVARALRPAVVALAALGLAACETDYVTIAPDVGKATTRLGPTEGSATSSLAIVYPPWFPVLCFIPWGWDQRAQTAYGKAVASVPGATSVSDVTIQEDWTWWLLATSRKLTVRGEAVKQ
jgi:hypothetical protein